MDCRNRIDRWEAIQKNESIMAHQGSLLPQSIDSEEPFLSVGFNGNSGFKGVSALTALKKLTEEIHFPFGLIASNYRPKTC